MWGGASQLFAHLRLWTEDADCNMWTTLLLLCATSIHARRDESGTPLPKVMDVIGKCPLQGHHLF